MTLLAIDPGRSVKEASIGYCIFGTNGPKDWREIERGSLMWDDFVKKLVVRDEGPNVVTPWLAFDDYYIEEVVIENFINNTRSRGGQTNGTSEVIGAVEYACIKGDTPFKRQPNTILPVAKLHAGYEQTLKHLPHQDAAFLHGFYYLVGKGRLTPKGLESTM